MSEKSPTFPSGKPLAVIENHYMEELDKIEWGFIFSAIGIAFGWLLNQLGQWLSSKQKDKRSIKLVLFNLLETYFVLSKCDIDKYIAKYVAKVMLKAPEEERTDEMREIFTTQLSQVVSQQISPQLTEELTKVQHNYQNAVIDLASIDPVTAYYLSGRPNPLEAFEKMQHWIEEISLESPDEEDSINKGKRVLSQLKPDVFDKAMNSLEKDILKISWKINLGTWFRSKKVITQAKLNLNSELDRKIDSLIELLEFE